MRKLMALVAAAIFAAGTTVEADTHTVANSNDSGAGSLRQAVIDAAANDTIEFVLASGSETITLTTSEIAFDKALTINGANTGGSGTAVTVQVTTPGTSTFRVFTIAATTSLSNMTIMGGLVEYSGSIYHPIGDLTLDNVTVSSSKASKSGGGIYSSGNALTISNSTISNCPRRQTAWAAASIPPTTR